MPPARILLRAFLVAGLLLATACDLTALTANSTAQMFKRASPAIEQHWDFEMVGAAMPASITQLEGVHRIVPENPDLLEQLVRVYVSYAFGWIEDEIEQLELEGDYDAAESISYRARLFYQRARDLGIHWIELNKPQLSDKVAEGLPAFEDWLKDSFTKEKHAPMLLWTGYAWGSMINQAKDDMAAVADLPYAVALVQRSVELDPTYFNSAGLTFMAVVEAMSMSADLEQSKAYFEQALEATEGKVLMVHLNYAKAYAVKAQDRELFEKLLRQVVTAEDLMPEARLANMIAKRRAARYLEHIDTYF
jgi:tetratricopeptide (TPR) repeat protein